MNGNVQRGRATRGHLIDVATRLFAAQGYDDTSIEAVLREAGVSRGSLYHHFAGKDALFLAVLERVGERIDADLAEAMRDAPDRVAALKTGCLAWIRMAADPVIGQIVLLDSPAVLGWRRFKSEDQRSIGEITAAVGDAARAGSIRPEHVEVFAHALQAGVNEIALLIAAADDPDAAVTDGEEALTAFLSRVLDPRPDEGG